MNTRKILTGLSMAAAISPLSGAPFEADANTLLLSGFENGSKYADYSLGWKKFAGSGATPTEGYYGKGLDLRQRAFLFDNLKSDDYTAYYAGWGLYPDGNINYRQGTFECWVKPITPKDPTVPGGGFVNAFVTRTVKHAKGYYVGTRIGFNTYNLNFLLPFLNGEYLESRIVFSGVEGYKRALAPDWHHFALCWSPGEGAIYLDGRLVTAWDMTGKHGLAIAANPVRYLQMADCVLDELRISDVVRYSDNFEPNWRDGKRPAPAFSGVPGVKRYPQKLETPFRMTVFQTENSGAANDLFDPAARQKLFTGQFAPAMRLYTGLERKELAASPVESVGNESGTTVFTRKFGGVTSENRVTNRTQDTVLWETRLTNHADKEQWLEASLTMPVPFTPNEYFDGTEHRSDLRFQRCRDTYRCTLPAVAAADGKEFIMVGLDPSWPYNDLVNVYVPGTVPVIGQGTRVALSPGESFTVKFVVTRKNGIFGTLEAVDAYHRLFPQFYRLDPEVTRYSYLPATQYLVSSPLINMQRAGFAGGLWGHGPSHTKGNEYSSEAFWGMEKYRDNKSWSHAARMEKMWGSLEKLRECIYYDYKNAFDQAYPVRRFHYCPDQMPEWLIRELWPDYVPNDDPLCFGQYYYPLPGPLSGFYSVNEYRTPLGRYAIDQTVKYFDHGMKNLSPGWINDMGTSGSLYRFNDEIARKTSGRSFARELGTFVRAPMGRQERYEVINNLWSNGYKASIWSDGSWFSYTVQAYSSALAVEGAHYFENLSGNGAALEYSRHTLGAKPITAMTGLNHYGFQRLAAPPAKLAEPAAMREFLRYHFDQLMLYALQYGIQLDPASYLWGKQNMMEYQPLLIESTAYGRQLISGGTVNKPLWLKRGGEGFGTVILAGNNQSRAECADIVLDSRYAGGTLIPGNYYGGNCRSEIADGKIRFSTVIPSRRAEGWKALAFWRGGGTVSVASRFNGDGLTMNVGLTMDNTDAGKLELNPFKPLYRIESITVNGRAVNTEVLDLPAGRNTVQVQYRNQVLHFSAAEFDQLEFFKGKETNFRLIADAGTVRKAAIRTWQLGFERGTANLLAEFARQYDWEDGIRGNTVLPRFAHEYDPSYSGWQVRVDASAAANGCTIDSGKRLVTISGASQGEARRAMVVFLRQLERKYPMVGGLTPLESIHGKFNLGGKIDFDKLLKDKTTAAIFRNVKDPDFLLKPLLNPEYDALYADKTGDFTGRYRLRVMPFLFEPTYDDNFVYGYSGKARD